MKNILKITSLALVISLAACHKHEPCEEETTPPCVKERIENLADEECPIFESVYQYTYHGQKVYAFVPGDCGADMTTEITDGKCQTMCYLGGITGNQDCNGDEFEKVARDKKLIWQR